MTIRLYGLGDRLSRDVDEWSIDRREVEAKLRDVLDDEPALAGALFVFELEFDVNLN